MHSEKVGAFRANRTEKVGAFRTNKTQKGGGFTAAHTLGPKHTFFCAVLPFSPNLMVGLLNECNNLARDIKLNKKVLIDFFNKTCVNSSCCKQVYSLHHIKAIKTKL